MNLASKPPATLNASLFDTFEDFLQRNGLRAMLPDNSVFGADGVLQMQSTPSLRGRRLLKQLAEWAKRIRHSNVEIDLARPEHMKAMGESVDALSFIVRDPTWIEIDGIDAAKHTPIEARFEDGHWRIGAQTGARLNYETTVHNYRYSRPGMGDSY
jgi:hypothetical protein